MTDSVTWFFELVCANKSKTSKLTGRWIDIHVHVLHLLRRLYRFVYLCVLRSLLASRSSVFTAMLYGSLLETRAVIEVTDIMPDIFSLMKKYRQDRRIWCLLYYRLCTVCRISHAWSVIVILVYDYVYLILRSIYVDLSTKTVLKVSMPTILSSCTTQRINTKSFAWKKFARRKSRR